MHRPLWILSVAATCTLAACGARSGAPAASASASASAMGAESAATDPVAPSSTTLATFTGQVGPSSPTSWTPTGCYSGAEPFAVPYATHVFENTGAEPIAFFAEVRWRGDVGVLYVYKRFDPLDPSKNCVSEYFDEGLLEAFVPSGYTHAHDLWVDAGESVVLVFTTAVEGGSVAYDASLTKIDE